MKLLISFYVAFFAALALAEAEDVPKCPSETGNVVAELKKMTINKDIFDHLLGSHLTLWGPQAILDKDNTTKLDFMRERTSDKEFKQTTYISGLVLGNQTRNHTWMKVDNGTFLVKNLSGAVFAKVYNLYNENSITAQYTCLMDPKEDAVLPPFFTTITVPTNLIYGSAPYKVFKSVVQIVQDIEAKKQVLGELAAYDFSQIY